MTSVLAVLWKIALALMVLMALAEIVRDSHYLLALVAVLLPMGIVVVNRRRISARRTSFVDGMQAAQDGAAIHQLSPHDPDRIDPMSRS